MSTIEVNGRTVQADAGEMLLTVLRREGIYVPTLCHMEDMLPTGACRLCVVEVEGIPGLVPSCAFPVSEGQKFRPTRQGRLGHERRLSSCFWQTTQMTASTVPEMASVICRTCLASLGCASDAILAPTGS